MIGYICLQHNETKQQAPGPTTWHQQLYITHTEGATTVTFTTTLVVTVALRLSQQLAVNAKSWLLGAARDPATTNTFTHTFVATTVATTYSVPPTQTTTKTTPKPTETNQTLPTRTCPLAGPKGSSPAVSPTDVHTNTRGPSPAVLTPAAPQPTLYHVLCGP